MNLEKDIQQRYRQFLFDINDFKIVQQIESGAFGSVYSVQNTKTEEICAAKIINTHKDEAQYKQMITREIGIMVRCKHPAIIRFIGYSPKDFHGNNNVTIFMELSKKGSLADLLQKVTRGLLEDSYDNTNRQIILVGIARGMMYLHQHQIIHRDLKPGNILLDDNMHPYITDFGLSKLSESGHSMSQSQQYGTSIYMAPEVFEGNRYNGKADVYSFGILMYEVVTDLMPYPLLQKGKMTSFQFSNKVVNENYRPEFSVPVKKSIQKLIEKCWSKNPNERPTFEEIFKKLAYNYTHSIDEIYSDQQEKSQNEEEDEEDFYLEDVDVDVVVSYADEINNPAVTMKEGQDLSKYDDIIKSLQEDNEITKRKVDYLKNENDMLKKNLEEKTNQYCQDIVSLQKDNQMLKYNLTEINNKYNQLLSYIQATNESRNREIEEIRRENQEKSKEIDELKHKFKELRKENESNRNIIRESANQKENSKSSSNEMITSDVINKENEDDSSEKHSSEKPTINEDKKARSKKDIDKEKRHSTKKDDKKDSKKEKKTSKEEKKKSLNLDEKMTIKSFNSLSLKEQQSIISEISKRKFKQIYKKINTLLLYLLKYSNDQGEKSSYFEIDPKKGDDILNKIRDEPRISLLHPAIEMLANNDSLNKPELEKYMKVFDDSIIEIKYPSSLYEKSSNIASFLQEKLESKVKLAVFITGTNTTTIFAGHSMNIVKLDTTINKIDPKAFANCTYLTQINIPSSVKSIPDEAFQSCKSLKHIIIPSSVTSIGKSSFSECESLCRINIPSTVTLIDSCAFKGCRSLDQFVVPSSLSSFGNEILEKSPFVACSSLTQVIFEDNTLLKKLNKYLFCNLSLVEISLPNSVKTIGDSCFSNCKSLSKITLSSSLTEIGNFAFYQCSSLKYITFPSTLITIGNGSFEFCGSLYSITLPSSVTSVGSNAFQYCSSIKHLELSPSLTELGAYVFEHCYDISEVTLPSNLKRINERAFGSCFSIKSINIPESVEYIAPDAFGEKTEIVKSKNTS